MPPRGKPAISASKDTIDESSLSLATLAMQMIAFVLLGLRWEIRLGRPGDPFNVTPPDITDPWALYRLGAWQDVNNIIFGIGQVNIGSTVQPVFGTSTPSLPRQQPSNSLTPALSCATNIISRQQL